MSKKHRDQDQSIGTETVPTDTTATDPQVKESKADKFKRLANRRVPVMLKSMRAVERLLDRKFYEWTQKHAEVLAGELTRAYQHIMDRLAETNQHKPEDVADMF